MPTWHARVWLQLGSLSHVASSELYTPRGAYHVPLGVRVEPRCSKYVTTSRYSLKAIPGRVAALVKIRQKQIRVTLSK
jgi:hypothetical protein